MYASILNVLLSIIFAIMLAWLALFTVCVGNDSRWCKYEKKYIVVGGLASSVTMFHFLFVQLDKSTNLLKSKSKPFPIKKKNSIFQYALLLTNKEQKEEPKDNIRNIGWTIEFEDGVSLFVSVYEISELLLLSCMNQKKIDVANKTNVKSPLSQRLFSHIGRRKLRAYKKLLRDCNVVVYHNANVERLICTDPWDILEKIRRINPENKIIDY